MRSVRVSKRIFLWAALAIVGGLGVAASSQGQQGGTAYSIELSGTIDPATQRWLDTALEDAADQDAQVAIIRLDTPGGLDTSLREMVKEILAAPMPVIVYVSPDGARAASAGVYITEAADVAAMSPQTNIGSATPISIGPGGNESDVLGRKIRNDAAAYVRALAAAHGRNPQLAERMVRKATNVTAEEARQAGLIDVIATDERSLLDMVNGFRVEGPKEQTLHTEGLQIERHDMPLQYQLLEIIVNPTVAYLLLLAGMVGLAVELFTGGSTIAPGVLGGLCLLLGLYGTAQLPVTLTGILLLVGGVALIVAEAHLPTHGVVGATGVAAMIASGLLLYDTGSDAFEVSAPIVILVGALLGGLIAFAVQRTVVAHREQARTGWEELVGAVGEVRVPLDPVGQVFVEGALWRARLADGRESDERGYRVRVESVEGLTLEVRPTTDGAPEVGERAEEGAG
jgi:membrane-bound serine protease (ClpP class)